MSVRTNTLCAVNSIRSRTKFDPFNWIIVTAYHEYATSQMLSKPDIETTTRLPATNGGIHISCSDYRKNCFLNFV